MAIDAADFLKWLLVFGIQPGGGGGSGLAYQGTWNASTNTPTLVSSVGTAGHFYIVSVAGTTTLNGISNWNVGDWVIFQGGVWQQIPVQEFGNTLVADCASEVDYSGSAAVYNNGASGVGATLTNNGAQAAFTADGIIPSVGQLVVIPGCVADGERNGLYRLTNAGSVSTNWVLTRVAGFDSGAEIYLGRQIVVTAGNNFIGASFTVVFVAPVTIGTDPIIFESTYQVATAAYQNQNLSGVQSQPQSRLNLGLTEASTFDWTTVAGTSATMAVNNGYITGNAGLTTLALPATASVNDIVEITGYGAAGWAISQAAGQSIRFGSATTTVGVGGSISGATGTSIKLQCVVANTTYQVVNCFGVLTYV